MLNRDIFLEDFAMRFYPKYQLDHFEKDLFLPSKRLLHSLVLSPEEQKTLQNNTFKSNTLSIGSLLFSIATLFLYNRIPVIKKVQRRGRRILLKCMMLIVPYTFASFYVNYINMKFLVEMFEKNKETYKKYKQNGDIRLLNPNIIVSDY